MKEVFLSQLGLLTIDGDEGFYFMKKEENLLGAILTDVDDFNVAGTDEFIENVISIVECELNVSKIEKNVFHFTGLGIKVVKDGIEVFLDDFVDSLKDFQEDGG